MSSPPTELGQQPGAGLPAAFGPLRAEQLPSWMPPVLHTLYAGYAADSDLCEAAAARWVDRLVGLLSRRGSEVPFVVVHDWQARTVVPMMAVSAELASGPLERLHAGAASGQRFGEATWQAALEPVLRELYRHAYGYAEAYATARASAADYARDNNFTDEGAASFAESYATTSAGATRDSFAEANTLANTALLAAAYAADDPQTYAEAYPYALVQACAHAWAADGPSSTGELDGGPARRRQLAYARLADGLADSCAAVLG